LGCGNLDTEQSFPGVYGCSNAALPPGRLGLDPGAPIVTETNVSPVFFDEIQTQVDLDAPRPSGQRSESIGRSPNVTVAA
ncbi:MAG TPA: hypothetical protein VGH72_25195, partial [Pseudonocardia sp.]